MGLIATAKAESNYEIPPAGNHVGRCFALIDLGVQRQDYQGDVKWLPKLLIKWELFVEDEEGNLLTNEIDGKQMPFVIQKRYTLSLSTKANLRKDLEAWRGVPFTEEECKGFNLANVLGKYVMVNVTHSTKVQDGSERTYANIASLATVPKKLDKPEAVHQDVQFDLDAPDWALFDSFSPKLKELIESAQNFKPKSNAVTVAASVDPNDSDICF
jgi:hypothetical protein